MVFLTLGIVQLTSIQHARVMTEYAAFSAARAGIVWNGSNERMRDAAFFALLPTLGATENNATLSSTFGYAQGVDKAFADRKIGFVSGVQEPLAANMVGMLRVDTVNPAAHSDLNGLWNLPEHEAWKELEFDGPDTYAQDSKMEEAFGNYFSLDQVDPQQEAYRRATVLSLRLRYFYEMKIPFANWIIFTAWYATNSGRVLNGAIDRPTTETGVNMTNRNSDLTALRGAGRGLKHQRGFDSVTPAEMQELWDFSTSGLGGYGRRYYLPLTATYSMRMQSNFYRKWIMHDNPDWSL